MTQFDLFLTQDALESDYLDTIVGQSTAYVEFLERTKQPVPNMLGEFLSLDIYIGRSENSGHIAFCHQNYRFPAFSKGVLKAAKAIRAEEYVEVIDDLQQFMASSQVAAAGDDIFDWDRHAEFRLQEPLRALDKRSYAIALDLDDLNDRLDYCAEDVRTWVTTRYAKALDAGGLQTHLSYYALAAAWLLSHGNVITQTYEEREAMMLPTPQPAPQLADQYAPSKGWLSRLFKRKP